MNISTHISPTPTPTPKGLSDELSFSRSHAVWVEDEQQICVFKPLKMGYTGGFYQNWNLQSLCFKVQLNF